MTKRMMKMVFAALLALMMLTAPALGETVTDSQRLDTYYSLAFSYINSGRDYDKAMKYLDAALEYCSETSDAELYADIHLKKGCVYVMLADYAAGLTELDEAIRVQPDLQEAYLVKTQAYSESGDYAAAAENLEKYIELSGRTDMYETLAQFYTQSGNGEKALESYQAFIEANHVEGAEGAYTMGIYKRDIGQYEEAIKDFEACAEDADYGASAIYNQGVCYMRLNDYESAIAAFNRSQEKNAALDGVYYNIGICHMLLAQYPEAIEAFTASMESESYQLDALYNRAVCYVNSEQYQLAADDFTLYLQATAEPAEPAEPAETEAAEGEETETDGEAKAEELVKPAEAVNIATYYRGVCYLSLEKFDLAASDFTACIENGIAAEESLLNRGLSYLQGGQPELARDDFTACIEIDAIADDAVYYRSFAYRALGDNEVALIDLTACIEHGYRLGQTYYQRAQVYKELNDEEHYIEDLEASLDY